MVEPRFPFVAVDAADEADAEEASVLLFELGAQGVEERDASTLVKGTPGKTTLVASFATHEEAHAAIAELDPRYAARLEEVVGDAWRDAWKEHFRPFEICPGVVVRPPWEAYDGTVPIVLELEPGRAFGTGLHETTSLVCNALAANLADFRGKSVLDVGCGSGILALVALKLGAAHARAVDTDPDAVEVTRENAARNGMSAQVIADTASLDAIGDTYPTVVANIEARVLIPMAAELGARVAPGGLLVLSGILTTESAQVRTAFAAVAPGWTVNSRVLGEWSDLAMRKEV